MINLLAPTAKKQLKQLYTVRTMTVGLFAAAALVAIMAAMALPSYFALRYGQSHTAPQRMEDEKTKEATFARGQATVRDVQQKMEVLWPSKKGPHLLQPSEAFAHVTQALGSGATTTLLHKVLVRQFVYDGAATATLTVRGVAQDRESLRRFIGALEADPAIKNVEAPVANFLTDTALPFTLGLSFKTP